MLGKIIATVAALSALASGATHASGCVLQLANGDSHSSTSQHLQVNLEERIAASRSLLLTDTPDRYDFEFYLVRAQANDITRYPKDQKFRAFYVVTDSHRKFISADVVNCTNSGQECAASLVRELEETCKRMSNKSFKPKPLRGSA